jgi:glycosyltransferase involved in cell wall biosynthesis
MDKMKSIALVPAFNEEKTIEEVIFRLNSINLNAIVIDDGSIDRTSELSKKSGAIVLRHNKNKGKGEALNTGFEYILNNYRDVKNIVIVDSDLQYFPEESINLLKPLEGGEADFVMGYRNWSTVPFRHKLGNFVWRTSFNLLFGTNLKDTNCGFVALSINAMKKMKGAYGGYIIENMMLLAMLKNKLRIKQVPVKVEYKGKRGIASGIRVLLGCLIFIFREGVKHQLNKV